MDSENNTTEKNDMAAEDTAAETESAETETEDSGVAIPEVVIEPKEIRYRRNEICAGYEDRMESWQHI